MTVLKRPLALASGLLALAMLACQVGGTPPTPAPTATFLPLPTVGLPTVLAPTPTPLAVATQPPTTTPSAETAAIGGWVWHDLCAAVPDGAPPLSAPPPGCQAGADGGYRANGVREAAEPALGGVVVRLGTGACPATGLAESATAAAGPSYVFEGLSAGTYCVSIDPFAGANAAQLLPGRWTYPGLAEGLLGQTVSVAPGQRQLDLSFGWDYQYLPTGTEGTAVAATPGACAHAAAFVQDVTVPPNTVMAPGTAFVKTWRVSNLGNCAWGGAGDAVQSLVFVGGTALGAPAVVALPGVVPAGFTADLSVSLTAPTAPGTYLSEWKLQAGPGEVFGVGPEGAAPLAAQIVVTNSPAAQRPNAVFHAARQAAPLTLDGSLAEWPSLPYAVSAAAYRPENWTGPADLSAAFALGWDTTYLYLAARVTDDVYAQTQTGETLFRGDSLELLLDANLAGDFAEAVLSADDYQLGLSAGANRSTPEAFLWFPAARRGPASVILISQPEAGGGYRLEAAIPWSLWGVSPAAGSTFGFVLSLSDNDTPGAAEQQAMISTEAGRRLTDPTSWGTLVLD